MFYRLQYEHWPQALLKMNHLFNKSFIGHNAISLKKCDLPVQNF